MIAKFDYSKLVGQFFHAVDLDGKALKSQGHIIGNPEPGYYMIETFSFVDGGPYCNYLVHVSDMKNWMFYETDKEMVYSWEYGPASRFNTFLRTHGRGDGVRKKRK